MLNQEAISLPRDQDPEMNQKIYSKNVGTEPSHGHKKPTRLLRSAEKNTICDKNLTLGADHLIQHLISGGDDLGRGGIRTLHHDHLGELGGDIGV